jgi:hypothetical protein
VCGASGPRILLRKGQLLYLDFVRSTLRHLGRTL